MVSPKYRANTSYEAFYIPHFKKTSFSHHKSPTIYCTYFHWEVIRMENEVFCIFCYFALLCMRSMLLCGETIFCCEAFCIPHFKISWSRPNTEQILATKHFVYLILRFHGLAPHRHLASPTNIELSYSERISRALARGIRPRSSWIKRRRINCSFMPSTSRRRVLWLW